MSALEPGRPAEGKETDCDDVLERLTVFLDRELAVEDDVDMGRIQRHLDECAPCLAEHDVEAMIKMVVRRACRSDCAPVELRLKIMARIATA